MTSLSVREPDPAAVARLIGQLERMSDTAFAESLADYVMTNLRKPDPEDYASTSAYERDLQDWADLADDHAVEQAAFRSDTLAIRSFYAAEMLIKQANTLLQRRSDEKGKDWQARTAHYRTRVGMERRLLGVRVDGIRAAKGILPSQPNPRARALENLSRRHSKEFLQLLRYEQRQVEVKKAAEKARRKEAAKRRKAEERSAAGLPPRSRT